MYCCIFQYGEWPAEADGYREAVKAAVKPPSVNTPCTLYGLTSEQLRYELCLLWAAGQLVWQNCCQVHFPNIFVWLLFSNVIFFISW